RPDPARAQGCDLQLVTGESPITLSYTTSTVPRGCSSSSSLDTGHEVHILSVKWSKASGMLRLHPALWGQRFSPCQPTPGRDVPCPLPWLRLCLGPQDAYLTSGTTKEKGPEPSMVSSEEQLLSWAQTTYGGITSYSELRDPQWVQLHLGEDASSPLNCTPQDDFNATPHLKTEVFFHGVKGCSHSDAQSTRAAHIIHLQSEPSTPITEVNLSLSCPEDHVSNQLLILQSRANFTWSLFFKKCNIQVMASGYYRIMPIFPMVLPGKLLPDTEQGLIAKAFEKNCSTIASYSSIPATTSINLEILEHELVKKRTEMTTPPAPPTPPAELQPHQLLLMLKPWKCTDETMEITIIRSHLKVIKDLDIKDITLRDINCQAEKNATHFMLKSPLSHCGTLLGGRGYANNELVIKLSKGTALQSVRVAFQCEIPRELFLRLFPTAAFEVPQTELEVNKEAFLQVLLSDQDGGSPAIPGPVTLMVSPCFPPLTTGIHAVGGPPHSLVLKESRGSQPCPLSPQPPPLQNNTIFEKVLEVTVKDTWRPPNSRGLGLAAVLGITFGAFLIGALLTAGLWCIYLRTRPISKLQPVSSTAPASESSSTNHSIGSTQSTPCSTSSMA
ncbi:EGLN protein, partial [Sakesphorus luctuosus]|nr:EGLN protein [Sakesphorus luctuosus]